MGSQMTPRNCIVYSYLLSPACAFATVMNFCVLSLGAWFYVYHFGFTLVCLFVRPCLVAFLVTDAQYIFLNFAPICLLVSESKNVPRGFLKQGGFYPESPIFNPK